MTDAIQAVMPGATVVVPRALSNGTDTEISFSHDGRESCPPWPADDTCLQVRANWMSAGALVMSPEQLRQVTGIDDPQVDRVLAGGGAVAFSRYAVDENGRITLRAAPRRTQPGPSVSVPGLTFPDAPAPAQAVVGPAFDAQALGLRMVPSHVRFVVTPQPPTMDDLGRVQAEIARSPYPERMWSVDIDRADRFSNDDLTAIIVAAFAALLALVALVAALSVTALALADARPDLATTAAVGAAPRFRRRFAAAAAFLMAATGAVLGAAAGVAAAATIAAASVSRRPGVGVTWWWETPATPLHQGVATYPVGVLLVLVTGVPLLCAAFAWLFTRRAVPMTRRVRD